MPVHRRRRALFASMCTLTALAVAALVALFLARVTLPYKHGPEDRFEGGELSELDAELGYAPARRSAGLRIHSQSGLRYHVFTDGRGARVNAAGETTPDHVGILVLGCSYAWGHGVESEATFAQGLGRRFGLPVANLAFAGFGGVQSMLELERNTDLAPQVVVYAFIRDHLRRNVAPCAPLDAPFCLGQAHLRFDAADEPHVAPPELAYFERYAASFSREVIGRPLGPSDLVWGARITWARLTRRDLREPPDDPVLRGRAAAFVLERMARVAQRAGAALVIVHVPSLARGWSDPPPAPLLEALPRGARFLDLSAAVARHYADPAAPTLTLEEDAHPGPAGHELIADEIADFLRLDGLP